MIITSKNNPLIKQTASLKEKKGRKEHRLFLVEGRKMAQECAVSGFEIEKVFVSEQFSGDVSLFQDRIQLVSDDVLKHLSDEKTPQGIICSVRIPDRALQAPKGKCLFLDGVADPGNMGAIIRSANAAGYDEIYLAQECTDPYSPKSVRASMSGIFFTTVYIASREEILNVFKSSQTPLIVADMDGENVFNFQAPNKFALAIGNEGNGISVQTKANAAHTVKIPMAKTQESLNAAVSAGICMYVLCKNDFINEN